MVWRIMMLGVHLQRSQQALYGILQPSMAQIQKPQIAVPCRIVWIGCQTATQLRNGIIESSCSEQLHRCIIGLNSGDMCLQHGEPLGGIGQTRGGIAASGAEGSARIKLSLAGK